MNERFVNLKEEFKNERDRKRLQYESEGIAVKDFLDRVYKDFRSLKSFISKDDNQIYISYSMNGFAYCGTYDKILPDYKASWSVMKEALRFFQEENGQQYGELVEDTNTFNRVIFIIKF